MKINYEHSEGRCITPCPYGFRDGYEGGTKLVGSYACADCMHFVKDSFFENWVECDFEEKNLEKNIQK